MSRFQGVHIYMYLQLTSVLRSSCAEGLHFSALVPTGGLLEAPDRSLINQVLLVQKEYIIVNSKRLSRTNTEKSKHFASYELKPQFNMVYTRTKIILAGF